MADPGEQVWTWSADHSVGFWQRMQAIEASVHRWDAENAVGSAQPLDAALAADAIGQTFEVMAPTTSACRRVRPYSPGEPRALRSLRSGGRADHVGASDGGVDGGIELVCPASRLMNFG